MSASKNEPASVMRHALEQIRGRFSMEHERFVLFTTFNFAAPFFEANVLPLLVGDAVDELQGASETRYAINDDLGRAKCLVVCDRSTSPEPKGGMRYALLPVGLDRGRFHAKIMLMAGTLKETGQKGLWLSVGSGNLTLSGWALNREIVGMTAVSEQHAGELLLLLEWLRDQAQRLCDVSDAGKLEEEGDTRKILEALIVALRDQRQLAPQDAGLPALHLALPFASDEGDARGALLERLKDRTKWLKATVVSPYWSGVEKLVERLGVEQCTFVPSLNDGKYRFPLNPTDPSPAYERAFCKFRQDGERYTHAKALQLEGAGNTRVLCIGSANFTRAALATRGEALADDSFANVEAMLRYDLSGLENPWSKRFDPLDEAQLEAPDPDQAEDNAPPLPPFEAVALCDWETRVFHTRLTLLGHTPIHDVELRVDAARKRYETLSKEKPETARLSFNGVQPVRSFYVSYTLPGGERMAYTGLVTQANAMPDQLGYQPRPHLKKVLELLRGLDPNVPEGRTRERAALGVGGDGEEDAAEPTFDYFGLFQGTWKLLQYYAKPDPAGKMRDPYDRHAPYGVTTLYRAITAQPAQSAAEKIGRYVQLNELFSVVQRLGPAPDRESFPFKKEIEVQLRELRKDLAALLGKSESFRNMFGAATPARIHAFLEWFCDEIQKSNPSRAGAAHAQ